MINSSVVSLEKPQPHIDFSDWTSRLAELRSSSDVKRQFAYDLRHSAKQLRKQNKITTEWNTYHNDNKLAERIHELILWRAAYDFLLSDVDKELEALRVEKAQTEIELDALNTFISVTSSCLSNRDARRASELTHDLPNDELKKELCVEEENKKMLTEYCKMSWEKINLLEELKFRLTLDINNKTETITLDNKQLALSQDCADITFKPDPLRIPKNSKSLEKWLADQQSFLAESERELRLALGAREQLFLARGRVRNTMKTQVDATDFALRRRIYETKRAHAELDWQKKKMEDNMSKLVAEMASLQVSLNAKTNALKLAETRLENRTYRPMPEFALDTPDAGFKQEVQALRQTIKTLSGKYDMSKTFYNDLEAQCLRIGADLEDKGNTLETDIKALEVRDASREVLPSSQADRSIDLVNFKGRIPKD